MGAASEDRRARRSRRLLKQGLLELLREKGFSRISVRDITERMDLNRGTFYLHYPDTTALMRSIEDDMFSEVQQVVDAHLRETVEGRTLRPVFEPILDYVAGHREECQALLANDSSSGFLERIQELVYDNGTGLIRAWYAPESEEELAYLFSFITYGLVGLMKAWFVRDMALPKEDLLRLADLLVDGASRSTLGGR